MKLRLLDYLCCPMCGGTLTLTILREDTEVEDGRLACAGCSRDYPLVNGIPRILPDSLTGQVVNFHPEFFQRYAAEMQGYLGRAKTAATGWWPAERRTIRSYSYQWRKFKEMFPHWEQLFCWSVKPLEPAFFKDKVGVDAGCGYGRSLYYAASFGADVIGLDLSEAIEAARANTGHLPGAHFVQGDILHPPIRPQSLDFVYSIGVMQHLPNPRQGFLALSRLLSPGAPIAVWVYSRGRGRQIAAFTVMRMISTRMPLRVLDAACLALAAAQWGLWITPYKVLSKWRPTRALAARMPFTLYAQYPFRVLHADWFDGLSVPLVAYYKPEEIASWYRDANLSDTRIAPDWGGRAIGYAVAKAVGS